MKSSGFAKLDEWVYRCKLDRVKALGYPANYTGRLDGFYEWYTGNGMGNYLINNAGDPFEEAGALSSGDFEREVIEFFAPLDGTRCHTPMPDNLCDGIDIQRRNRQPERA